MTDSPFTWRAGGCHCGGVRFEAALPARVLAVRRTGAARRAELALADGLPSVEIELPTGHTARKGDLLPVTLVNLRLFSVP